MKYDYFIAGRWRNHHAIRDVLTKLRKAGKSAYCFIENEYDGNGIKFEVHSEVDADKMMKTTELLDDWKINPTFRKIFDNDMNGIKEAKELIMVFPAGRSAHMEVGVAYGLNKNCYAIGEPEKAETLYLMFDQIFPNVETFLEAQS